MDKLASFGYPFLLRVIGPGAFASLVFFLIISPLSRRYWTAPEPLTPISVLTLYWILGILVFGHICSLFDIVIYKIFEGRIGWPCRLAKCLTNRLQKRVTQTISKVGNLENSQDEGDKQRYDELWYWLRRFPTDNNGDPKVTRPTELGNIIEAYEGYSTTRYGMDSVFYWYRIWLRIDSDTRKEVDTSGAKADATTYISFLSLLGCVLVGVAFVYSLVNSEWSKSFHTDLRLLWGIALSSFLFLSWAFYRLSVLLHESYGEFFKAIFDVFRGQIVNVQPDFSRTSDEMKKWRETLAYLQYLQHEETQKEKGGSKNPE